MAVVLQTLVVNWDYVGGSRGVYMLAPGRPVAAVRHAYVQFLFAADAGAGDRIGADRLSLIERSWLGQGLTAIREDETAAECCGVATLRLKLIATVVSGALHGDGRGAVPVFHHLCRPGTAFNLAYGSTRWRCR